MTTAGNVDYSNRTYVQLQEENVALRLLLEEAKKNGAHAWSCPVALKTRKACDCWLSKTAAALVGDDGTTPRAADVPADRRCAGCRDKFSGHTGRLAGDTTGARVCCVCNCKCMSYVDPQAAASSGDGGKR